METSEQDQFMSSIVELITESWRLYHYTDDLVRRISDVRVQKRGLNQTARFHKHMKSAMDKLNLEIVDFTGQDYVTELPVHPINLDDFNSEDALFVDVTLEPVIKKKDSAEIISPGVVVVGRRDV